MKKKRERIPALLLAAALVLSVLPQNARASGCPVHETAQADCPDCVCTHVHGTACYRAETVCLHICDDGCAEGCAHVCSTETGCVTEVLACTHIHDGSCLPAGEPETPEENAPRTPGEDETPGEEAEISLFSDERAAAPMLEVSYPTVVCGQETVFTMNPSGVDPETCKFYLASIYLDGDLVVDPSTWGSKHPYSSNREIGFTFYANGVYTLRFYMMYPVGTMYRTTFQDVTVTVADPSARTCAQIVADVAAQCRSAVGASAADYQKALWLHDWVLANCTYNYNDYFYCHAEGALARGLGTCEAYHRAYVMLLNAVGISTGRVEGNGHVWTAVKLDGQWTQVDTTWDDCGYESEADNYLYFGLTDELMTLAHSDHKPDSAYPCTSLDNHYYIQSRRLIESWTAVYFSEMQSRIQGGERSFAVEANSYDSFSVPEIKFRIMAYDLGKRLSGDGLQAEVGFANKAFQIEVTDLRQKCGENLYWELGADGVLRITGTGAMDNYGAGDAPWLGQPAGISGLVLPEGLTSVGENAFAGCNLSSVTIPASVTAVGSGAFSGNPGLSASFSGDVPTLGEGAFDRQVSLRCPDTARWTAAAKANPDYRWTIPHTYALTADTADCTHAGTAAYTCSGCGDSYTRNTPAKGHSYASAVTPPTCTDDGYTTYICSVCGNGYTEPGEKAAGHSYGSWVTVREATPAAPGEERRSCTRCTAYETRSVPYVRELVHVPAEIASAGLYLDGYPVTPIRQGTDYGLDIPEGQTPMLTSYTYNRTDGDIHGQYPTGMRVYRVVSRNGSRYVEAVPELENLLRYSGSSIRISGNRGIRMITSLQKSVKDALTGGGLAGYTLEEYGTGLCFASDLAGGKELVLGADYTRSNFAYKRDAADPVFADTGSLVQYTNVLVGFNNEQCKVDIAMRPYINLRDESGTVHTLYGGTVYRSIGYIAYQNRSVFSPGSPAYTYVWDLIRNAYGSAFDSEYRG